MWSTSPHKIQFSLEAPIKPCLQVPSCILRGGRRSVPATDYTVDGSATRRTARSSGSVTIQTVTGTTTRSRWLSGVLWTQKQAWSWTSPTWKSLLKCPSASEFPIRWPFWFYIDCCRRSSYFFANFFCSIFCFVSVSAASSSFNDSVERNSVFCYYYWFILFIYNFSNHYLGKWSWRNLIWRYYKGQSIVLQVGFWWSTKWLGSLPSKNPQKENEGRCC